MRFGVRPAPPSAGRRDRSAGSSRSRTDRENRRWPPGVVNTCSRPASLQRRTVERTVDVLVPVAPLRVIRDGSDALGAGLVTGVMMACTVLAQLSMRRVLAGLGWRWTLMLGSGLLGLPALGHLATSRLWAVTALAGLRGLGFGVVTVCGATAVAAFAEPGRRGRAIGALGLASAAPQVALVPAAPWLAERAGFGLVFTLAVLPALAIPLAGPIARAIGEGDRGPADGAAGGTATLWHALAGPVTTLAVITAAGGAILTFTPHILAGPGPGFLGLLAFTGAAAACRT